MQTQEAIRTRCSLRSRLTDRPIPAEMLNTVLDAARLAPSARNTQPWRIVVVQGHAVPGFVERCFSGPAAAIAVAPAIIVVCARPEDDVTIDDKPYYLFDLGLAVENMLLAATDLGLVTHLMASFHEDEVRRALGIPDEYRVVIITPLAFPPDGDYAAAAAERLASRTKKTLPEIVYHGRWGN